ncbi:methylated-DNA--[protein]-cysteine S-methyltransferase [Pseudomarimonas salicorniae]|uniref:Methylated-DNA--protein-cysteine methyltransferase n=1 Tax=Pseudomarimonas salicorniae TaxID=2933270 RepID=A0ABT0GF73_9GAMM|nr:methylated-DNA--[protein]-cysteine S-methyltransferase [Lysobacter sp. CAU 1642]MCK7593194.1 methylated-DNA--[protein]-cysteine S-methyltransferase [Lysobacter sp. CAU 1642]
MTEARFRRLDTPIGVLTLIGEADRLTGILFARDGRPAPLNGDLAPAPGGFGAAVEQLGAYFEGRLRQFELDLQPRGTPFQREVWQALVQIRFGETESYAALAARIGRPSAVRAVGAANGRNPLPIIIPCHRVIGADGSLTGFGGGLPVKDWLLRHEAARTGREAPRQVGLFD